MIVWLTWNDLQLSVIIEKIEFILAFSMRSVICLNHPQLSESFMIYVIIISRDFYMIGNQPNYQDILRYLRNHLRLIWLSVLLPYFCLFCLIYIHSLPCQDVDQTFIWKGLINHRSFAIGNTFNDFPIFLFLGENYQ